VSFVHGRHAEVVAADRDLTPYFRDASLSASKDTADATTFRSDWRSHLSGLRSATIDLGGLYESVATDHVRGELTVDLPAVVTVGSGGLKPGDRAWLINAHTTSLDLSSPVGDVVAMDWSLQSTDPVFTGVGLKDVTAAVTAAGSGTVVDLGAAATGAPWCLHWHLVAINATNLTLSVQDSADGLTDWQPISGVTSGAQTATGAGRVVGTGNVRRYVRLAWTGTAITSATFTAAFARIS
jgi:hypothetical protein